LGEIAAFVISFRQDHAGLFILLSNKYQAYDGRNLSLSFISV